MKINIVLHLQNDFKGLCYLFKSMLGIAWAYNNRNSPYTQFYPCEARNTIVGRLFSGNRVYFEMHVKSYYGSANLRITIIRDIMYYTLK